MARRRKPRGAGQIYRDPNGDGWMLTGYGGMDKIRNGHMMELVFYYINGDGSTPEVETVEARNTGRSHGVDRTLRRYCGAKLGPYEGEKPEPNTDFENQPRAVRMQRHAVDIYRALSNARGMSRTIAVKGAETFGSTWREKTADDWAERVQGVGDGRASNFEDEMRRRGIIE